MFFVSDSTGITAETFGHSLLAQFPDTRFQQIRVPFVDDISKAQDCARRIQKAAHETSQRPIVFSSLVNPESAATLREAHGSAFFIDITLF